MTHTHECVSCGERFRCSADVIDNYDGWPEKLCSAEADGGDPTCEDCRDRHAEAAQESRNEAFYGSSQPQTITELSAAADRQRRELRRRDS